MTYYKNNYHTTWATKSYTHHTTSKIDSYDSQRVQNPENFSKEQILGCFIDLPTNQLSADPKKNTNLLIDKNYYSTNNNFFYALSEENLLNYSNSMDTFTFQPKVLNQNHMTSILTPHVLHIQDISGPNPYNHPSHQPLEESIFITSPQRSNSPNDNNSRVDNMEPTASHVITP